MPLYSRLSIDDIIDYEAWESEQIYSNKLSPRLMPKAIVLKIFGLWTF